MDIGKDYKELLEIASKYKELYKEAKSKFPYRINIISELHDNENAHSRILLQLLRYNDEGRYSILESFVKRMQMLCEGEVDICVEKPKLSGQYEFIDGFIWEDKKYAIVIENKIWGAKDQYEQIKRYVESASKHVSKDHIYVIYLTKDGTKSVAEDSLTADTERVLGKRFIPMSYKYDIIPWLKEDVYPNCKIKEEFLRSAIHQYVDYLEEVNGMLHYQKKIKKELLTKLFPNMNTIDKLQKFKELSEQLDNMNRLKSLLESEKREMESGVLKPFTRLTKEVFNELFGEDVCVTNDHTINHGWYQVRKKKWHPNIHLEWIRFNAESLFAQETRYTITLHVEGVQYNQYEKALNADARLAEINRQNSFNIKKPTFYSKSFTRKGLCLMTEDEMREFLKEVLASDDMKDIVDIVDRVIAKQ